MPGFVEKPVRIKVVTHNGVTVVVARNSVIGRCRIVAPG
jgi:hypothetical protein